VAYPQKARDLDRRGSDIFVINVTKPSRD